MNSGGAERVRREVLAVVAVIKPLTDTVRSSEVEWSRPYLVGFITTLIGLHFRIMASPLSDDELIHALAIAWKDITGMPWTDGLMRRGDEFIEGADKASRFVRSVHVQEKERDAAALWREVFVARVKQV